ncbi:MAG TPA: FAD-dependent oxidoreductase [Solimonas sp.]|nr:FAD-dependent oxidoreductase [Solimonas sp.]
MSDAVPDVLILGGGVVGLACAQALLAEGRSVTVLEARSAGSGASHGNCGTITPSHAPPLAAPGQVAIALRSLLHGDAPLHIKPRLDPALFAWLLRFAARCNSRDHATGMRAKAALLNSSRQLLAELIREHRLDCEFAESGTLYVYRDRAACERAARLAEPLRALGIPMQVLDGASARRMEPALNDSIAGALHFPLDARLRPDRLVAELARIVRAAGGRIVEHTAVTGFSVSGERVTQARTAAGDFAGREVVLALGAWSPQLGAGLGLKLPIQPGKGYSITYTRPRIWPRIPVTLRERSVCVTGWDSGFRLGSTMEFAGYDTSLNRTRLDALTRAAREYLVEPAGPELVEEWYGWRPMVYDDLPLIGRTARLSNLWLATGHGMLGVSNAAGTARMLADLVAGRAPMLDPRPYSPARFGQ